MDSNTADPTARSEWFAVAILTLVGGILRVWPPGRLGLVHFDEGIYAIAATWSLQPLGILSLDPSLIPYAPPGFPILVGLFYAILGPSDQAAIAVSQIAGAAAIPLVARLTRTSFGPGAGLAAATLAALSGPHIAFSRMAMTDATFLVAWLVAITLGIRFLDRPGLGRAVAMGLAVGLAQQCKYNGWLVGAIIVGASLGGIIRPAGRDPRQLSRIFGWGLIGGLSAAIVVLPWFLFVERHGGYSKLLDHQRSYLVGWKGWLGSFHLQQAQVVALSGGHWLGVGAWLGAATGAWLLRRSVPSVGPTGRADRFVAAALIATGAVLLVLIPDAAWWLSLGVMPWLITGPKPSSRVIGFWWLATSAITPFYHPYARLWLPVEAASWVVLGGVLSHGLAAAQPYLRRIRGRAAEADPGFWRFLLVWAWGIGLGVTCTRGMEILEVSPKPIKGLLAPSDGLRRAIDQAVLRFPKNLKVLRFYGRPSIRFYLGGRVPLQVHAEVHDILRPADPGTWTLIDFAQVSPRVIPPGIEGWERVEFLVAALNGPTMLDLEPDTAFDVFVFGQGPAAPLLIFKPRIPEVTP